MNTIDATDNRRVGTSAEAAVSRATRLQNALRYANTIGNMIGREQEELGGFADRMGGEQPPSNSVEALDALDVGGGVIGELEEALNIIYRRANTLSAISHRLNKIA